MKKAVRKIIGGTRYMVVLAVIGAFVAAAFTLVYGLIMVVVAIRDVLAEDRFTIVSTRLLSVSIIDIIDLLLLGTVLYIVAVGLYVLFLDEGIELHGWLAFNSLDDLKSRLISVVVVLLGVEFLSAVVEWHGNKSILQLGIAVGVAILSLAGFIAVTALINKKGESLGTPPPAGEPE